MGLPTPTLHTTRQTLKAEKQGSVVDLKSSVALGKTELNKESNSDWKLHPSIIPLKSSLFIWEKDRFSNSLLFF